jgi:anti-sigma factor RsiW
MNTSWAKRNLEAYVDGELGPVSSWVVRQHLTYSPELYDEYERRESAESLSALLRHLSDVQPPARLRTRIRLAISRESSPRFWARWKIHLDNLMRPLAVPAAGGVLAAVMSFLTLMGSVGIAPRMFAEDVPLAFFDKAFVATPEMRMPTPFSVTEETLVLAFIDGEGSVYDFRVISNDGRRPNAKLTAELASALVTTRFEPAMSFGRPVPGTMLITLRPADRVEVRG